jgi:hypothetical protein
MVPDERITPKGIKIRCPRCRFVFIMKAQQRTTPAAGPAATASGAIGGAAASGAIGGTAASGAIGGAAASGAIGGAAAPAAERKTTRKRRAPTEQEVAGLSPEELAALDQEEIVDMDDVAQATEQSGTAFNPNVKAEHFQLPGDEGPSVMIDDSLLSAAADHKASWTEEPTAGEHVRRIDPNQLSVSDTWIDLPGSETPTPPMGIRAMAAAAQAPAAPESAAQAPEAPAPEPQEPAGPTEPMAVPPSAAAGELGAQTPAEPAEAPEAEAQAGAAPAAPEEPSIQVDEAYAATAPPAEPAASIPPAEPAVPAGPGALDSVLPAIGPTAAGEAEEEIDVDVDLREEAPVTGTPAPSAPAAATGPVRMAYTLTAASTVSDAELAELDEYEGWLVEERKALRKGSGAIVLTIIGVVGGIVILGLLGYLGWQALHPPEPKPPSWGHLKLSGLEHDRVDPQNRPSVVKVLVDVSNTSEDKRFKDVHVKAAIVSPSGRVKCENYAPCGPVFDDEEIRSIRPDTYHDTIKSKIKGIAYKVQLIGGQHEKCQILLFCGDEYEVGSDKVKVEVDRKRTERLME